MIEICILAGGLSTRMGRDKARVRIGRYSMLGLAKRTAVSTGRPVRVIRRDLVPHCGPLSGIYTALKTSQAERVLFLPCDMPFVTTQILETLIARSTRQADRAMFVQLDDRLGFPFILPRSAIDAVQTQIERGHFSLQVLARRLRARIVSARKSWKPQLRNINTPADLAAARKQSVTL